MMREGYPRPQFERNDWLNLNGTWTCHVSRKAPYARTLDDPTRSSSHGFEQTITIPFAPGTPASNYPIDEIIDTIWYHRTITRPAAWKGKRCMLHFGAVFYHAEVFLDGKSVGFHNGGSTPFAFDITDFVDDSQPHDLVVKATANLQDGTIPSGKQSSYKASYGCYYQRTTGIWQTVYLEAVAEQSLISVDTVWNGREVVFTPMFRSLADSMELEIAVEGERARRVPALQGCPTAITIAQPRLWECGNGQLYRVTYRVLLKGKVVDEVKSYVGLRTIAIKQNQIYLNGKRLFLRMVLDQGFYPEGNWTAPSDDALAHDIELSLSAGFNGARLHQKVFEERFLYEADKRGYLLWGEFPSWGLDYNDAGLPARNFLDEWTAVVERDKNHPSIIAWTPLNETYLFKNPEAHRRLHHEAYRLTKAIDPTRLVNDASGYIHAETDLWTVHTYEQNSEALKAMLQLDAQGQPFRNYPKEECDYQGQPYLVDEYGGVKWDETSEQTKNTEQKKLQSWGYGEEPDSAEACLERIRQLTEALLSLKHIAGYCYTQLTDVEQERNGIFTYQREAKFPIDRIHAIFSQKPDGYDL